MFDTLHALSCNHRWDGGLPSGHNWCPRCKRYDDNPAVLQAERIIGWWRRWTPIALRARHGDAYVRIGNYHWHLHATARLHYRWRRDEELPGLHLGLEVWRLHVYAGLGSGWQGEDGEDRSLLQLGASVKTYGLRYIGCWRGHKPKTYEGTRGYTYCERCDEQIDEGA
jgi:hypothetical protein